MFVLKVTEPMMKVSIMVPANIEVKTIFEISGADNGQKMIGEDDPVWSFNQSARVVKACCR